MLERPNRQLIIAIGLLALVVGGCGGGGPSESSYSASQFSRCLTGRDAGAQQMDTSPSSERYIDALDRLAGEAARQNGALQAFGNDALPNASTLYFLFFTDGGRAMALGASRRAKQRGDPGRCPAGPRRGDALRSHRTPQGAGADRPR